jgi:predicted dehydrogenase
MARKIIRFGIIGCGLMGREFASAAARWCHLQNMEVVPRICAVCDVNPQALQWFEEMVPDLRLVTTDYHHLLEDPEIDAIYCALPHHLHAQAYSDCIRAGKHLLGEKPFGIDHQANASILKTLEQYPGPLVRCSSELPFFPGAYRLAQWVREGRFGRIIEVEAGFWHSSDLNPSKPINWKRRSATNGAYGCMGDLGMHVLHLPLRFGWKPHRLKAFLSNIVTQRPDETGTLVPCDTWDNALLACDVVSEEQEFPMLLSMKRIAPGHANTWFLRIIGTRLSAEYSTKNPKQLAWLPYSPGDEQIWRVIDMPYQSAYPTITGSIFEFGFSDSLLQMWAAFCDEVVNGSEMNQPLYCATPREAEATHQIFTTALQSHQQAQALLVDEHDREQASG